MKKTSSTLLLALALLLTVAGVGTLLADDDGNGRYRIHSKSRVVIVGADGEPHSESIEWESDKPPAFLGVALERNDDGARVSRVITDSPAEAAGLQEGDIIVSLDGKSIESPMDVTRAVWSAAAGDNVEIEVLRNGRKKLLSAELTVSDFSFGRGLPHFDTEAFEQRMEEMSERLGNMEFNFDFDSEEFSERMEEFGERMSEMDFNFDFDFGDFDGETFRFIGVRSGRPVLGVELVEVTPELRQHLGARDNEGVLIGRVIEDSAAEAAGLEVGDMIVALDGESVESAGDLRHLLRERQGESFGIDIIRDGSPQSLTVVLPDAEDLQERHERRHVRPARQTSLHT